MFDLSNSTHFAAAETVDQDDGAVVRFTQGKC